MNNSERNFVKIIKEICEEESIKIDSFSYDWIFKLSKEERNNYIIGYQFGLNTASVNSICCDKSAASEIMSALNIPNIEHSFFMAPINEKYIGEVGNWIPLTKLLNKYGKLVCKTNEGTGGNMVFRVSNQYELENAVHKIFKISRSLAVSPYYEIKNEYRVIVLDGNIKLIYKKVRPYIIGDGINSIAYLVSDAIRINGFNFDYSILDEDMEKVLEMGEIYYLSWKHNLGKGANAIIVDDKSIINKIEKISLDIVRELNIRFASVDIAETTDEYKVIEINSGVMMEHFSQQDNNAYKITKDIYKEAILKMFE